MLHCFELHGTKIVYDAETQALLTCGIEAYRILQFLEKKQLDGLVAWVTTEELESIAQTYDLDVQALKDCWDELANLVSDGYLAADFPDIDMKRLYPDKPKIKSMCLHLSHDCNLRCKYCFAGTGDFGSGCREMLPLETGKKAIDFLIHASGPRRNLDIDFFGGEPLMNWKVLKELTLYCEEQGPKHGKDIRLTCTTNAILLNDEKMKFLNEHMKNCVLSIDGRPEIQDLMRPSIGGKGSYKFVMPKIKKFIKQRAGKEYYVRGTFTHFNTDFTDDCLHLRDEGLEQISVEPVVADPSMDYAIKPEDVPHILEEYERLAKIYDETKDGDKPWRFFHFNINLNGGPCAYKRFKGCGAGIEYIAVTPDGKIYPCHQFVGQDSFIMGSVDDDPDELDQKVQSAFARLIVPQMPHCKYCWAKYYCGGGCVANAWNQTGDLEGKYEIGCQMQMKRLECSLWLEIRKRQKRADRIAAIKQAKRAQKAQTPDPIENSCEDCSTCEMDSVYAHSVNR